MEIDDKSREQLVRLLTVAAPLYTTSLAICYDVGFFSGLDIGFFTFYSITEHLVFALQALPWALIPALTIFSVASILWWGYRFSKNEVAAFTEKIKAASEEEKQQTLDRLRNDIRRNKVINVIVWISAAGIFAASIRFETFTTAFLIATSQSIYQFVFHNNRLDNPLVRAGLIGILISTGWIASFLLGYDRSHTVLKAEAPSEIIHSDAGEQKIRIIRSGDKGLLFKSFETNKATFLRWDSIKRIEVL
jgi:hypothetical protein